MAIYAEMHEICRKCGAPRSKRLSYCPNCYTTFRIFSYPYLVISAELFAIAIISLIAVLIVPQPEGNLLYAQVFISAEFVSAFSMIVLSYYSMKRIKEGRQLRFEVEEEEAVEPRRRP